MKNRIFPLKCESVNLTKADFAVIYNALIRRHSELSKVADEYEELDPESFNDMMQYSYSSTMAELYHLSDLIEKFDKLI